MVILIILKSHYFFSFPLSCHSLLCYFFLLSNFIFASFQVRFQGRSDVVCHPAFISLHGITKSRLTRLALASSTSTCAPKDMWGKHTNSHQTSNMWSHKVVPCHEISLFKGKDLSFVSFCHFCYLLLKYVERHESSSSNALVKYSYYLKTFNEDFNFSLGYPKTDTCGTCDQLKLTLVLQKKTTLKMKMNMSPTSFSWEILQQSSYRHRNSQKNDHVATVTFHFQQNLPLPHIPVGDVFYMHQLWLYVFGVHSCGDNRVSMYCYPETTAGSDEVISCLHHFFSELPPEVTSLRLCVLWWVCRSKQSNPLSVYSGVCRQI